MIFRWLFFVPDCFMLCIFSFPLQFEIRQLRAHLAQQDLDLAAEREAALQVPHMLNQQSSNRYKVVATGDSDDEATENITELRPARGESCLHAVYQPVLLFSYVELLNLLNNFPFKSELITFPEDCIFPLLQESYVCFRVADDVLFMNKFQPEPIKYPWTKMTVMYLTQHVSSILIITSIKH